MFLNIIFFLIRRARSHNTNVLFFFFFFHLPPPSSSSSSNLSKKKYLSYSCSCCRHHSRSPTAHHPEHHAHCSGLSTFKLGSSCAAPGALCTMCAAQLLLVCAAPGASRNRCAAAPLAQPHQVRCCTSAASPWGAVVRRWCAQHACTAPVERAAPVRCAAPLQCAGGAQVVSAAPRFRLHHRVLAAPWRCVLSPLLTGARCTSCRWVVWDSHASLHRPSAINAHHACRNLDSTALWWWTQHLAAPKRCATLHLDRVDLAAAQHLLVLLIAQHNLRRFVWLMLLVASGMGSEISLCPSGQRGIGAHCPMNQYEPPLMVVWSESLHAFGKKILNMQCISNRFYQTNNASKI
ncbi:hypothetical protein I3843_06G008600 [Carya illinoinensis]|nr:hypothetical protein I3843_06G008600 [Carya illinoinensis]